MAGERRPLIAYWKAQEGEFALAGAGLGARGREAPVVHLDQAGPLRSDRDGRVLVDGPWGIYFRMGRTGTGITGGGLPVLLDGSRARSVRPRQPRARGRAGVRRVLHLRPGDRAAALPRPRRRLAGDPRRRHRLPHARQLPGLRLGADERLRDRRLGPRLQDARDRPARRRTRCSRGEPRLEPFRLGRFARGERRRRRRARTLDLKPRRRSRPRRERLGARSRARSYGTADRGDLRVRREARSLLRRAVDCARAAAGPRTRTRSPRSSTTPSAAPSWRFRVLPVGLGLVVPRWPSSSRSPATSSPSSSCCRWRVMLWLFSSGPSHRRRYRGDRGPPEAGSSAPTEASDARRLDGARRRGVGRGPPAAFGVSSRSGTPAAGPGRWRQM